MDQGWAAVIAAGVAGVVALIGAFIGVWLGRRTVRDQAHVEHDQWLRGQRQEAYASLLTVWDETVPKFDLHVLEVHEIDILDEESGWETAHEQALDEVARIAVPVEQAAERVHLLGPKSVEDAAAAMVETVVSLAYGITAQYAPPGGQGRFDAYQEAKSQKADRRSEFISAARKVLQTAPDPRRR